MLDCIHLSSPKSHTQLTFPLPLWSSFSELPEVLSLQLRSSFCPQINLLWGFPGGSVGKGSACNAGDLGSIPGWGRPAGGGHGNLLQYSCLENPYGQRSLAGYSPWGRKESDTTVQQSQAHKRPWLPTLITCVFLNQHKQSIVCATWAVTVFIRVGAPQSQEQD